ncbi:hypothetical protein OIDMADRAFT_157799 [Oidiodendron maius Zn]|uniref:Acid protease 1 n=1 Tax=Oidiodendron maius (strain Zn) TaxID=913774 RepID=A0A0C3DSW1_OIDMZ|nr:hypothetical protein OIDMADRAFT_157799 [Oidiodendron maius Zn]
MKFAAVVSTLLLVGSAVAAPGTAMRAERHRKRVASGRKGNPIRRVDSVAVTNKTNVEYSSNWAGAILIGSGYTSVTGTFTVPTPSSTGSGSAWVGIDGDTCDTAILQTGIDWTKSGSSITYDAWYEWYPDYAYDFSGISLSAGDSVTVTVTATSKTAGTAVITNNTTGKKVTHTFSNEGSEGDLCETNAEWIVEDFEEGSSLVTFADFGTVTFTGASAKSGSSSVGVSGATIIDIEQSSKILTDCSTSGSSTVTCSYV